MLGLTTEGIYRKSGQQSVITRLVDSLTTGSDIFHSVYNLSFNFLFHSPTVNFLFLFRFCSTNTNNNNNNNNLGLTGQQLVWER